MPFVSGAAPERPHVAIIALARARLRLAPVVMTFAVVRAASIPAARRVGVPLLVARVVVARVEIKHRDLHMNQFP
ncbi:MAG: hypothetical protein LC791_16295 [Acidobacteria bacterium]|nr:hypothetical protein [Acidobacteriota bacterium]